MLYEALDLDEKTIKEVYMRDKLYQRKVVKRYNSWVKPRNFQEGDLVLRKYGEAWKKDNKEEKLATNWESLIKVTK